MLHNTSMASGPSSASPSSPTSRDDAHVPLEFGSISQRTHTRKKSSTSDDFGSFVSVPALDDPLGARLSGSSPTVPINPSAFGAFIDSARQRSRRNQNRVLDELREHDEDPRAWLKAGGEVTTFKNDPRDDSDIVPSSDEGPHSLAASFNVKNAEKSNLLTSSVDAARDLLVDEVTPSSEAGRLSRDPMLRPASALLSASSNEEALGPSAAGTSSHSTPSDDGLEEGPLSGFDLNEDPKERAEGSGKRILDELLAHEEDPPGWLKPKTGEESLSSSLQESGSVLIDLNTSGIEVPESPSRSHTPSVSSSSFTRQPPQPSSLPRAISSPSIPRPPDRARSHSPTDHTAKSPSLNSNISSSIALSRSWMSNLGLFGAARAVPASSSPSAARGTHDTAVTDAGSAGLSPTQSSLHALFSKAGPPSPRARRHSRFATEGHSPVHSATMPLPLSSDVSPFASHVYIPPSGAPGFVGDRNWNPGGFEFDTRKKTDGKNVRLVGRNEITVPVLDPAIATALRPHLPPLARLAQSWKLLYSADQHGLSLNTLYARCTPPVVVGGGGIVPGTNAGALVAVQDADGGVFGAWIPEGVHLSHGSYYGGGDSFLWSVDKKDIKSKDDVHVYKWTGQNGYVAYCDLDGFSFGGGDGHYGLYVDASLVEGTTHPCPTFDNECLAHGERKGRMIAFDAVGLEVWGIGS